MDAHLLVYDLSGGMAKQLSMSFLGFQLDAIYHTSIELNGLEYVYDGGINLIQPGSSHLGQPLERIHLGQTDLPMDVISEYVDSLREVFTPQAYDLFRHNCNNFSNDFATFLVGKGIPDHIANMPQAVLDSPFGRMLQPQLEQMVQQRKAQQGGLLGIQNGGGAQGNGQIQSSAPIPAKASPSVRNVGSLSELNTVLEATVNSCTIVFFTSATCPPCKALYPLYDELAAEWGDKVTLVMVDVSRAFDAGQRYSIRGTPTFITFVHGREEERWSGADSSRLRGTVSLLAHMAHPTHPHESLKLPHFVGSPDPKPVLYSKVPPISKLLAKLPAATAEDPAIQGLKAFIEARTNQGPAQAHLPPDMPALSVFLRSAIRDLPTETLFPLVDLFRCALVDPRFSGYFAEEGATPSSSDAPTTAVSTILSTVNSLDDCPYALRLVTLQMGCNLFSSPLAADQALSSSSLLLRTPMVQLISTSFLDSAHSNIRVAAASLLYNLASAHSIHRRSRKPSGATGTLPESDQVELAASLLEAISQENDSSEALRGMLLALGYLVYCLPQEEYDGEFADLLNVLDAKGTVLGKKKEGKFKGDEEAVALIREVGEELLGKGFVRR